jgi:hypothetical protein
VAKMTKRFVRTGSGERYRPFDTSPVDLRANVRPSRTNGGGSIDIVANVVRTPVDGAPYAARPRQELTLDPEEFLDLVDAVARSTIPGVRVKLAAKVIESMTNAEIGRALRLAINRRAPKKRSIVVHGAA